MLTHFEQDVSGIIEELHRQGIIQEDIRSSVNAIVEAVSPLLKKSAEMSDFDITVNDQGDQIKITQSALENHVWNKAIHVSET